MSGSYFDDVLRDPRRYGIKNTTDKVRRPGAVRRRRDAVRTERVVGKPEVCRVISVEAKSPSHSLSIQKAGFGLRKLARTGLFRQFLEVPSTGGKCCTPVILFDRLGAQ